LDLYLAYGFALFQGSIILLFSSGKRIQEKREIRRKKREKEKGEKKGKEKRKEKGKRKLKKGGKRRKNCIKRKRNIIILLY